MLIILFINVILMLLNVTFLEHISFCLLFYLYLLFLGQTYMFLCVGIMIVKLIRRFRFATTATMKDINITHDILLRSPDNIKLSLSYV